MKRELKKSNWKNLNLWGTSFDSEHHRAWLRDIDLNIADYDGRTPLHLAASEGYYECVHFLIYTVQVHPNPRDR